MSHVIMKFSFSHIYVVLYTQGCCLNLCRVLVFFGRVVSGFFVGFLFFFLNRSCVYEQLFQAEIIRYKALVHMHITLQSLLWCWILNVQPTELKIYSSLVKKTPAVRTFYGLLRKEVVFCCFLLVMHMVCD